MSWWDEVAAQTELSTDGLIWALHPGWLVHQMWQPTALQEPFIRMIRIWQSPRTGNEDGSTISWFYTSDLSVQGYMLEPAGPSTTEPNQNRRIPAGVYQLRRHRGRDYEHVPRLENGQVHKDRAILIHRGNRPDNTQGCLLPGANWLHNYRNNPNWVDASIQGMVEAIMMFLTNTSKKEDYKVVDDNDLDSNRARLVIEEDFQATAAEAKAWSLALRRRLIGN